MASTAAAEPLQSGQVVDLWPGTPPGTETSTAKPEIVERSKILFHADRALIGIVEPQLTAIVPEHPNGASLIVAPGGAYARVVLDKEGMEVADALGPDGVTVFLMTYRLPAEGHADGKDVPLQDGQRAVRLIRQHAEEWGLDPDRVGYLGFSAAGHLGASLITGYDKPVYDPIDEADSLSARPDFAVLMYPVVSMQDDIAHMGSRTALLGENPSQELKDEFSPELHVTADTPQTFMALADDDSSVPPENAVRLYLALKKAGVPTELHIFRDGGHGFGIAGAGDKPARKWPMLCRWWLKQIGVL
ncbi:alpha/beta hydrolase [Consotaella sp. CSK11QG-6]